MSGNGQMAFGSGNVRYIKRDVGLFAGLRTNSPEDLKELHTLLPFHSQVILFTDGEINVPVEWEVVFKKEIYQMVCEKPVPESANRRPPVPLSDKDIAAMIALTSLTKPGPFFSRTIDFGNYEGIFIDHQLVAMAGQRLQPLPYIEVSAVCTHPDHTGKGYAAQLIRSQVNKIISLSGKAFLHVYPDNLNAVHLYKKTGFEVRKEMLVYVLKNQGVAPMAQ